MHGDRRLGGDFLYAPADPGFNGADSFTVVRAGGLYAYVPEVADPNGQSLTYTLDEAPIRMTVELSGRILWVPGLYQLGSHQVTLRATDPDGNFELQTFVVEVVANAPPQVTSIAPGSGTEARLYHYRIVAADPDPGDLLAYQLVVAPDGAVFDSGLLTGEILWTPTDAQTGPQRFQVVVTDLSEATAVQDWIVEVTDINTPPAFVSAPPSVAGVGQDLAYRVEAVDPDAKDAGKLVYSLSRGPRGMVLDRATNVLHFTATSDQVGLHRVDLRAADPLGLVGYQSFWLRVSLTGFPPQIVSKPPRGASVGYVLRHQVEADHPDAAAVLTFSLDVGPPGATLGASSGLLEWAPFTAGEATFSIRVSDVCAVRWLSRAFARIERLSQAESLPLIGIRIRDAIRLPMDWGLFYEELLQEQSLLHGVRGARSKTLHYLSALTQQYLYEEDPLKPHGPSLAFLHDWLLDLASCLSEEDPEGRLVEWDLVEAEALLSRPS